MNYKSLLAKPALALAAIAALGGGAGVAALASADTATTSTTQSATATTQGFAGRPDRAPGVHGKITAISGNTITIEDQGFGQNSTATTYTVDASAASIVKMTAPATQGSAPTETTLSISSLAVGDEIGVQGSVSGTTVTATKIMSGIGRMGFGHGGMGRGHGTSGTVSAVSGNTITITSDNGTSYTVDASNATVSKMVTEPVSSIVVGDRIAADGSVSGTTVTATHIMAGIPTPPSTAPQQ